MAWEGVFEGEGGWLRTLGRFGPLAPRGVQRAKRTERTAEELGRTALRNGVQVEGEFDPDLGASGRPAALWTAPGSGRSRRPESVQLGTAHSWCSWLKWTGGRLLLEQKRVDSRPWPVPLVECAGATKRHGPVVVREVALFVTRWAGRPGSVPGEPATARVLRGSLHFLNDQGFAVGVVANVSGLFPLSIAQVTEAAGLPFRLYALPCSRREAQELARLLFPPHRRCVTWED